MTDHVSSLQLCNPSPCRIRAKMRRRSKGDYTSPKVESRRDTHVAVSINNLRMSACFAERVIDKVSAVDPGRQRATPAPLNSTRSGRCGYGRLESRIVIGGEVLKRLHAIAGKTGSVHDSQPLRHNCCKAANGRSSRRRQRCGSECLFGLYRCGHNVLFRDRWPVAEL